MRRGVTVISHVDEHGKAGHADRDNTTKGKATMNRRGRVGAICPSKERVI